MRFSKSKSFTSTTTQTLESRNDRYSWWHCLDARRMPLIVGGAHDDFLRFNLNFGFFEAANRFAGNHNVVSEITTP